MLILFPQTRAAHPSRSTSQLSLREVEKRHNRDVSSGRFRATTLLKAEKERDRGLTRIKEFEKTQPSPAIRLDINHVCELHAV